MTLAGRAEPLVARLASGHPLADRLREGETVACDWLPADARLLTD